MLGDTGGSMDHMSGVTSLGTGMPQQPPGGGDPEMYYMDTGGADISVPGDYQYEYAGSADHIQDDLENYAQNVMKEALPTGGFKEDTGGVGTGGGEGGAGTNVPGTPIVPTGLTAAESAQSFQDAKEAEIAKVQAAAAASGAPFEHYYVGGKPTAEQEKFMQEHEAAASMVGREAWPAAYGGRTPAAFGGIMDSATGRRAYGLGSIGKVFKKAVKAISKVAKSPVGMMALTGVLGGLPMFGAAGAKQSAWKKFLPSLIGTGMKPGSFTGKVAGPFSYLNTERFLPGSGDTGWLGKLLLKGGADEWSMANLSPMKSIGLLSTLPFLTQGKKAKRPAMLGDYGKSLDLLGVRKEVQAGNVARSKYPYLNPTKYAAQGGRIGYQDGLTVAEKGPLYIDPKTTLPLHNIEKRFQNMSRDERLKEYFEMLRKIESYKDLIEVGERPYEELLHWGPMGGSELTGGGSGWPEMTEALEYTEHPAAEALYEKVEHYNKGGRTGYQNGRSARSIALNQLYGIAPKRKEAQEGGLMNLGGMEKDYRQEGGFVPLGGEELADDVPARLSKNEFVFTADAVRAAGGGDIDKGAEVMENVMNNLEQGGQVSEDSQGLEGARNMFATAQRLEGVL